jgi:cobalt-zinc-cadmium efflux system protein
MAADAALSAGVVVAGIVILFTGWLRLDPAVSLVLAAVIVLGTWRLLRVSIDLAFDGVPKNTDSAGVRKYLASLARKRTRLACAVRDRLRLVDQLRSER